MTPCVRSHRTLDTDILPYHRGNISPSMHYCLDWYGAKDQDRLSVHPTLSASAPPYHHASWRISPQRVFSLYPTGSAMDGRSFPHRLNVFGSGDHGLGNKEPRGHGQYRRNSTRKRNPMHRLRAGLAASRRLRLCFRGRQRLHHRAERVHSKFFAKCRRHLWRRFKTSRGFGNSNPHRQ